MESLRWVDKTYTQKHEQDDPKQLRAMYYPNMIQYPTSRKPAKAPKSVTSGKSSPRSIPDAANAFFHRYAKKIGLMVAIYIASLTPVVGRLVAPAVSFYAFRRTVGTNPAAVIFGIGLLLPRRFLITFLQTYFSSRSLMRDLVCLEREERETIDRLLTFQLNSWIPTSAA